MPSLVRQLADATAISAQICAELAAEIEQHARRRLPDLRDASLAQLSAEASFVFGAIYALSGDSSVAIAEAVAWLDAHPRIRGPGPGVFVESWAFYNQPEEGRSALRR